MAKQIVNNEVIEEQVNASKDENLAKVNRTLSQKDIINSLIAKGCKKVESLHVKNVNYTEKDNYVQVVFSIKESIKGYVGEDGVFTLSDVNNIFTSTFPLAAILKENEDTAWLAKPIIDNPKMLGLIFGGATLTILQQEVAAGEEFINPFTTSTNVEPTYFDHDTIINHVINIKFGKTGEKMIDRLADKMLGF